MSKYLVIVESPTKARTISSILGADYQVSSSMGHIVDLPARRLSVDVEAGFEPSYKVIKGKEKIISQLKKEAKNKEIIYLATDPDREGEAISWHIQYQLLKVKKTSKAKKTKKKEPSIKPESFRRVIFHEITDDALKESFQNPGYVNMNKVNARIARRVLDRIVGYSLSPLLWKKIVRGLSAGRVQSVALKFIVEREKEIKDFIPKTTYGVEAKFRAGDKSFSARLSKYKDQPLPFESKEEAQKCIEEIKKGGFCVSQILIKEVKRKPPPPHTTSLLQQEAFNKLRFSSRKTMLVAQKLYEGVQIRERIVGLITYMRTDSFHVSPKAKVKVKEFIKSTYGQDYLPDQEYQYKTKKGAQLAHEAIRPTGIRRQPHDLENILTDDEAKLYNLVWRRFIASFMKEAMYENTKIVISSGEAEFTAEGRRILFEGFLKVSDKKEDIEQESLPQLKEKQTLTLEDANISEHTTKPPPHFNDASLVKLLEEKGIGRPSTYAPTIYTLIIRHYMNREKGYFISTELGEKVTKLLSEYFSDVINENFTASIEEKLDEVEDGQIEWRRILQDFYPVFKKDIDKAMESIQKEVEFSDKTCPQCGGRLVIKWSRKGKFLSCEKFPECRYAESITTGVSCPECKEGKLIQRRNKKGQFFYGCSRFPECRYTSRKLPQEQKPEEEKKE
ncbi:MAG: type I DNA topoisomerase [Candidatus Omnitrophota bacterium]|nr:MAG: type I DNA topoisomerase [Candidatus Omnitrophota bacterium]